MPLTSSYERYEPISQFNVVASAACNIRALDAHTAVVGAAEHVRAYNLRTADTLYELSATSSVQCVCVASRSRLAAGYADGSVRVYNRQQNKPAGDKETTEESVPPPPVVFDGHRTGVSCLCFAPDEMTLASGGKDCVVILWDVVSECGLFRLIGHKGAITQMKFTKDAKYLLTSSKDTFVKFWCVSSQSCFFTLADHRSEVYDFVLLRDDTRLICGSAEAELRVYNVKWLDDTQADAPNELEDNHTDSIAQQSNRYVRCTAEGVVLRNSKGRTFQLCATTDETLLVVVGAGTQYDIFKMFTADETIKRIRKKMRHARKQLSEGAELPDGFEDAIKMDFSTQISRLSTQKMSGKIKSVDFAPSAVQKTVGDDTELQYRLFAVLSNNSIECVTMNTLKSGELSYASLQSPCSLAGHRTDVRAAAFSHDGYAILTASQEAVKIWNRHSVKCVSTMECDSPILCAVFVLGDRHCVLGTRTGALYIYDVSSGICCEQLKEAHEDAVWSLCLNHDATKCMTASADKTIKIWHFELKTVEESKQVTVTARRTLVLPDEALCAVWTPKDTYLVAGLLNNNAMVYFADTFKPFLTLHGHSLPVLCVDVSSDESLVVTGSADKNIKIWGLDFGDCRKSLFAHDAAVTCVRFVPNSKLLWSAGKDGRLKMWDAQTQQMVVTYKEHTDEIWCLCVNQDGKRVLSASHDQSVRLWQKSEELVVLEEEREQQREREYESTIADGVDVVPGEVPDAEVGIAAKRNILTVKSAESLIEAIEIVRLERLEKDDPSHKAHALLQAMNVTNLDHFVADTLRRVRSSDLERCLLLLPHGFILDVMQALTNCVVDGHQLELCNRVLLFLCKAFYHQLAGNEEAAKVLDQMTHVLPPKVCQRRDVLGENLAALRLMKWELEERNDVQLFLEAHEIAKKKTKKRKRGIDQALMVALR